MDRSAGTPKTGNTCTQEGEAQPGTNPGHDRGVGFTSLLGHPSGSGSRRDVGCTFIRQRFRRRKGLLYVVTGRRNLPLHLHQEGKSSKKHRCFDVVVFVIQPTRY